MNEIIRYKIWKIDGKIRWIYLEYDLGYNDGLWEIEEAFVEFLQRINKNLGGKIIEVGNCAYRIDADKLNLIFQYDYCFGITVQYPAEVELSKAVDFLEKIFGG